MTPLTMRNTAAAAGLANTVRKKCSSTRPVTPRLRGDLQHALERWTDEEAAAVTERAIIASALAKVALALGQLTSPTAMTAALHLHSQAAAARIAALLDDAPPPSRLSLTLLPVAAIAIALLAWAMPDTERFYEAARLWRHT